MDKRKEENERFLDLDCVPEFQISETENALAVANAQKAKSVLDELLNDATVKGEIRKKILRCTKILGSEE